MYILVRVSCDILKIVCIHLLHAVRHESPMIYAYIMCKFSVRVARQQAIFILKINWCSCFIEFGCFVFIHNYLMNQAKIR